MEAQGLARPASSPPRSYSGTSTVHRVTPSVMRSSGSPPWSSRCAENRWGPKGRAR